MEQESPIPDIASVSGMLFEMGKALVRMKDLPEEERQRYRDVIHETYVLLESAILLVMNKLASLINMANKYHLILEGAKRYPEHSQEYRDQARDISMQFVLELGKLGSPQEWEEVEQKVSLCTPLSDVAGEIESFRSKLRARVSFQDTDIVKRGISDILKEERPFAQFISSNLKELASLMKEAGQSDAGLEKAMKKVFEVRDEFDSIRNSLIEAELEFRKSLAAK
jgi:hypothetical protein